MKKTLVLVAMFMVTCLSYAQKTTYTSDKPAYIIYDGKGNVATYDQMIKEMNKKDVCLFGEIHNDPISHWMEMEVLKSLHQAKGEKFVVGSEMWETDNQLLLDELQVSKLIDGPTYLESSKLWPNKDTDYMPLFKYCIKNNIYFVATNVPRRYARIVYKKGINYLDSLSDLAKSYLPPLPIHFNLEESIYKSMASVFPTDEEFYAEQKAGKKSKNPMMQAAPSNLVKAQAIKDATMAWNIIKNMDGGKYLYHFHGEMHSANHTSIEYYLKYYKPAVKVGSISVVEQADINKLSDENMNRADFIVVIPDNMAETYIQQLF